MKEKLLDRLQKIEKELNERIQEAVPYVTSALVVRDYLRDGKNVYRYHCQKCGTTDEIIIDGETRRHYFGAIDRARHLVKCGCCGNEDLLFPPINHPTFSEPQYYFEKTEDGFVAVKFKYEVIYWEIPEEGIFSWMDHLPETTLTVCWYAMCDGNSLAAYSPSHRDPYRTGTNKWENILSEARWKGSEYERRIINSMLEKKEASAATKKEDKKAVYVAKDVPANPPKINGMLSIVTDTSSNKSKHAVYCLKCGHLFSETYDEYERECKCPVCGNEERYASSHSRSHVALLESTDLPGNELLVRFFEFVASIDLSEGVDVRNMETARWFIGVKNGKPYSSVYINANDNSGFKKASLRDIPVYKTWNKTPACLWNLDEARDIIEDSALCQSGLIEAWGLNPLYRGPFKPGDLTYLFAWLKAPAIEKIAKLNIPSFSKEVITSMSNNLYDVDITQDSVNGILHISKAALKGVRVHGWNLLTARLFDRFRELDPSLTEEDMEYTNTLHNENQIIALLSDFGLSFKMIRAYVDRCYDYQCIDRNEACGLWYDYLRMARRLGYDLDDKSRKFPNSLKKEHDIAIFAYNKVKDQIQEEIFAEQAKVNKDLLEYSFGDMFVKVPETTREVIGEATAQRNCLRSYLDRLAEGRTRVAFIRKKDEADKSYITCEITTDGRIVQVKGYCNSNPRNTEVNEFIRHWANAKKLRDCA